MRNRKYVWTVLLALALCGQGQRTTAQNNTLAIDPAWTPGEIAAQSVRVVPSPRQYSWQRLEMTAFLHFGINTFTNREWGDGKESPALFNPTALDARQWVQVCKAAGFKLIILTAKHHDGFCLWPSAFTEHSVKHSPWKNGQGDVVRELAEACRAEGMKLGIYLSPWDRHEKTYGDSEAYNRYFCHQLRELLTNYGTVSEVWFDGACGEGANGKKQVYDWAAYYSVVRECQPDAVIAIMGPDVRWVGTESGYGRDTEWSVIPMEQQNTDDIAANSQQQAADIAFIPAGDRMKPDLGSRDVIRTAKSLVWYPAEVDVSIRPGWFWHPEQNKEVKKKEQLFDIYLNSAGKNSLLLINIPPDTAGKIHESDIESLQLFRSMVDVSFARNLATGAKLSTSAHKKTLRLTDLTDDQYETSWTSAQSDTCPLIALEFPRAVTANAVVLQEDIRHGQRVERFRISAEVQGKWRVLSEGTTVGYRRILCFPAIQTKHMKIEILQSRAAPVLSTLGVYKIIK